MSTPSPRSALDAVYRTESRRVLATLIRLLGGFDAAEEGVHEAFVAAAEQWPREGVPDNPYAWLVSAGRFKILSRWRRQTRLAGALGESVSDGISQTDAAAETTMPEHLPDDELRLIFTCCHPALAPDARIALTLREVGGLTTEEIARAYLVPPPTIGQRIVRAKAKIRDDALPYEVALGLLALMLLHEARRATRIDASGDLVLLEDQDRSQWDPARITEAQGLIDRALLARRVGPFLLQAAIAAVHAEAPSSAKTENSAAALAMRDGPEAGLAAIEAVLHDGGLDDYHLAHAARADMQRRLGLDEAARASYERALALTRQPAERRFLQARIARLG